MGYIFFYENYDIFKTEQLCANLYKLMEMILLSIKLKKTLVIPNFYFTPRDNEKISINNKLDIDRIEFIDIQNFLDINTLKNICDIISINDFFEKKLLCTLFQKNNDDIPYNNNKYFTIYGIININKKIDIEYSSLNILKYEQMFNDHENIIIHNYNRMGNPIWYKNNEGIYNLIRKSIRFNDHIYSSINFEINYDKTLLVHWRRGDFLLDIGVENETKEYYKKYNKLNQIDNIFKNILLRCLENNLKEVFLLTNESNIDLIETLSNKLKNFDIDLIKYNKINNNNYLNYLLNDISGIIIGSKCKYQLHGYGNYDRMSQYGRWIIEENPNNTIYFVE